MRIYEIETFAENRYKEYTVTKKEILADIEKKGFVFANFGYKIVLNIDYKHFTGAELSGVPQFKTPRHIDYYVNIIKSELRDQVISNVLGSID